MGCCERHGEVQKNIERKPKRDERIERCDTLTTEAIGKVIEKKAQQEGARTGLMPWKRGGSHEEKYHLQ